MKTTTIKHEPTAQKSEMSKKRRMRIERKIDATKKTEKEHVEDTQVKKRQGADATASKQNAEVTRQGVKCRNRQGRSQVRK